MSLDPSIIDAVRDAADRAGIPRDALLAVVEVESAGAPLEADGKTPRLLFERHIYYREIKARRPDLLERAVAQGLAIPKWSRTTQYKDQGRSGQRLQLLARARALDVECANRSCSWGLGQTMGFVHAEIGFASATEMVAWMTDGGVAAQIEAMVREIRAKGLVDELQDGRWTAFARAYNGPGYAANAYDTKLGQAQAAWARRVPPAGPAAQPPAPPAAPSKETVESVQRRLRELGYTEVGNVDGLGGPRTRAGILAFRADAALPLVDGIDADLLVALAGAKPREIAPTRAMASLAEVAAKVPAVAAARSIRALSAGQAAVTGSAALLMGIADNIGTATERLGPLKLLMGGIPAWAWIGAVACVSYLLWRAAGRAEASAAADYRNARTM